MPSFLAKSKSKQTCACATRNQTVSSIFKLHAALGNLISRPTHKPVFFCLVVLSASNLRQVNFSMNNILDTGNCQSVVRRLSGGRQAVFRQSSSSCQGVVRQSSGSRQAVVSQSSASRQAVRLSPNALML